jgi:pectin methylesterase-like acyl-CoA thioesterase
MIDLTGSLRDPRIRGVSKVPFRFPAFALFALALPQAGFALTRQTFSFVVGVNGDFKAAMSAAAGAASSGNRFYIFFPDGQYNIGSLTGDANQMTTFPTSNVSFIGQSADNTVVYNQNTSEGIGVTSTLYFNGANNLYLQDLTLLNKSNYGNTSTYNTTGRHVVVMEQGNKIVYKNVKLKSTQDTYYTRGTRTYWEGGEIDGTTDFICGGGDIYFNRVLLWEMKVSDITASQSSSSWGYVFNNCTVDGTVGGTNLGRSWGAARVVFLNTTMNKLPSAAGWGNPMDSNPLRLAEYKSTTSTGSAVDLSKRRTTYTLNGTTVTLNPVLTDAQAATYTLANVLGGTDNWQPQNSTVQEAAPVVARVGTTLDWNDDATALCWVVFKNGKYLANVTTNSYNGSSLSKGDTITVRAANAMGGLGASSNRLVYGTTTTIQGTGAAGLSHQYNSASKTLRIMASQPGETSVRLYALNGSPAFSHVAQLTAPDHRLDISLGALKPGTYLLRYSVGEATGAGSIEVW